MKKLPKIPDLLLQLFLKHDDYLEKSGDFTEIYHVMKEESGYLYAVLWVYNQTIKSIFACYLDKLYWGGAMFKNYLLISFRNLVKQKVYSFINVFGLAVGLACCLLIALFISKELSFDDYHVNKDRIYLIGENYTIGGQTNLGSASNALTATVLASELPQVEKAARIRFQHTTKVKYGDKSFSERDLIYADPEIFQIFSWNIILGDPENLLNTPYSIVVSRTIC